MNITVIFRVHDLSLLLRKAQEHDQGNPDAADLYTPDESGARYAIFTCLYNDLCPLDCGFEIL